MPWWNQECLEAIKKAKTVFNRFKEHNTIENKIEHNKRKAISKRTLREAHKSYWLEFVKTLNIHTPSVIIWQTIQKIRGNKKPTKITALKIDNQVINDHQEIANKLAEIFANNFRSFEVKFEVFKSSVE